jgi:hypothetical protein
MIANIISFTLSLIICTALNYSFSGVLLFPVLSVLGAVNLIRHNCGLAGLP